ELVADGIERGAQLTREGDVLPLPGARGRVAELGWPRPGDDLEAGGRPAGRDRRTRRRGGRRTRQLDCIEVDGAGRGAGVGRPLLEFADEQAIRPVTRGQAQPTAP